MALRLVGARLTAEGAPAYVRDMQRAGDATRALEGAAEQGARGLSGLNVVSGALAVTIGNVLTGMIQRAIGSISGLAREAFQSVVSYEQLTLSMEALIAKEIRAADATLDMEAALEKAAPRAQELLGWIQQLAIESPFESEDVTSAFKTALTFGFVSQEAQKLAENMLNFAAATGQSGAVIGRMAYALGQVHTAGRAMTQDLRQLTSVGVDVTGILRSMGKGWQDVTAGTVTADEFLKAFNETMEKDFGSAAARFSGTWQGLLSTLSDIKKIGLRELFVPAGDYLKQEFLPIVSKIQETFIPAMQKAGVVLGELTRFVLENKDAILKTIVVIAAFVAGFLLVVNAGAIISGVIATVTALVGGLAAAVTFLLNPLNLLGLVIGGLAALFIISFNDIDFAASDFFENFGDNLFQWGHDMILSLANGMATAIGYVLDVLISIGNMIASWLAPGSPPKLLPELDEWGADALNEWLQGFTQADFGVFDQLSGQLESFLRALPTDILPAAELVPTILNAREAIAQAINEMRTTGAVGEDAFNGIFEALTVTNPELEGYVRALFDATAASEALKIANDALIAAQQELTDIQEEYAALLKPIDEQLAAITAAQTEDARQEREAYLESILADPTADAVAKERAERELLQISLERQRDQILLEQAAAEDAAQTNIDAAQEQVDAAQVAYDAAQAQLEIQTSLLNTQIETNKLLSEQKSLLESLASAASGAGAALKGAGEAVKESLEAISGAAGGLGDAMGTALENLKGKVAGFLEEISGPFATLQGKIQTLGRVWGDVFTQMGADLGLFVGGFNVGVSSTGDDWTAWKILTEGGGTDFQNFTFAVGTLIGQFVEDIEQGVVDSKAQLEDLKIYLGEWKENFQVVVDAITDAWEEFFGPGGLLNNALWGPGGAGDIMLGLLDWIDKDFRQPLLGYIGEITTGFEADVARWTAVFDTVKAAIESVLTTLTNLWNFLVNHKFEFDFSWPTVPDDYEPDSPQMKLQTRFERLLDFLNTATFEPHFATPAPVYLPATAGQMQNSYTNYYNNSGGNVNMANVNVNNGMDLAMLTATIEQVVARTIG